MKQVSAGKKLAVYAPILLSVVILAWLVYPNLDSLLVTLKSADLFFLLCSLLFSVASYILMGLSLWEVLRILGHTLPFLEIFSVAFVSTTVNYFVSSAGISGFATRAHLLGKRKVPYGASVTSSVVITVLIYLSLAVIVVQGAVLQFLQTPEFHHSILESVIGVGAVLTFAFLLTLLFFHHELRTSWGRKIFLAVNRVIYFFSRKEIPHENFDKFESQLDEGIRTIHGRRFELPVVIGYIFADWLSNILILYFAFKAIGVSMGATMLVAGFAFGMVMTVIPILPGGLGAMEAAMTAAFSGMGVPVAKALAASLIFRFLYYLLPAFASIFVYWGLHATEPKYSGAHSRHGRRI